MELEVEKQKSDILILGVIAEASKLRKFFKIGKRFQRGKAGLPQDPKKIKHKTKL